VDLELFDFAKGVMLDEMAEGSEVGVLGASFSDVDLLNMKILFEVDISFESEKRNNYFEEGLPYLVRSEFEHTHLRFWKTVKISPFSSASDMIRSASCVVLVNGFSTTTNNHLCQLSQPTVSG
jgi:hypothetical protein